MLGLRIPRWKAVTGSLAALVLLLGLAVIAGASPASARTTPAAASRGKPLAGKAPLKDLIGQPVRHVKPPVTPSRYLGRQRAPKVPAGSTAACPKAPRPGQAGCTAASRPVRASAAKAAADRAVTADAKPKSAAAAAAAAVTGYSPAQLQQAYGLTSAAATGGTAGGAPETVALVEAYDDPSAAADLAAFRAQYAQAPCITTANVADYSLPLGSGCVTKVNEDNQASPLPPAPPDPGSDWTWQESEAIDTVSAICPNCQILLVEADQSSLAGLGQSTVTAENDASFITGDWAVPEFPGETDDDQAYLNAPGKALVFPAGSTGTTATWPAAAQYVTSVGGTTLTADTSTSRGYTETAWSGGTADCSTLEPKPSWQADTGANGCPNRTQNDVSADATSGVAAYDSTAFSDRDAGWRQATGTTVAAAIITAAYALAGVPQPGTYPASYPYQSGSSSGFNDITSGDPNGTCESNRQYLCNPETGYDAQTGQGTPDGTSGLAYNASGDTVTVPDPGTQDYGPSEKVSIPLQASSSDSSQAITWTASGLPNGLAVNSATGAITGTLPSAADTTSKVTATATDATGAAGSVSFNIVTTGKLSAGWTPVSGPVTTGVSGECADDPDGNTAAGTSIDIYTCNSGANQDFQYSPGDNPGQGGAIQPTAATGMCLTASGLASGSKTSLQPCDGDDRQAWTAEENEAFVNPASGLCLTDTSHGTASNVQFDIEACTAAAWQEFAFPASEITSGITGDCLDDYQNSTATGTAIDVATCDNQVGQQWIPRSGNTLHVNSHCIDITGASTADGGTAEVNTCDTGTSEEWTITPSGEIINLNSGKCLADPGNATASGTTLEQSDCTGDPGEIWEAS